MKDKRKKTREKPAVELVSEAVQLVRTAPLSTLVSYYIGAVPFVAGLLFFWSDMSRSAFARDRCLAASLGLALLFIWMKCWHAIYAGALFDHVSGRAPARLTLRRLLRILRIQLAIQPWGLLVLPVSLLVTAPFFPCYAFYQGASAVGDGRHESATETMRRAWRQAMQSPRQNAIVVWLLSPWILAVAMLLTFGTSRLVVSLMPELQYLHGVVWFFMAMAMMIQIGIALAPLGCVVAGNIALLLIITPTLLRSLLGIHTTFSLSGWHAIFNTTFLFSVFSMTYLCLDPLAKAAYALRSFYEESVLSGNDIRVEVRHLAGRTKKVLAILLLALLSCTTTLAASPAQEQTAVSAGELDAHIERTLDNPRYSWRAPRQRELVEREPGIIASFLQDVGRTLRKGLRAILEKIADILDWLELHINLPDRHGDAPGWQQSVQTLLFVLLAAVASVAAIFLYRHLRRRKPTVEATALTPIPNIADEDTTAEELPSDEWTQLAHDLMTKGEVRLALRAFFFAALARLAERGSLVLARHKSNRDYGRELRRKAEAESCVSAFAENVRILEAAWYGNHELTDETTAEFRTNHEAIVGYGTAN